MAIQGNGTGTDAPGGGEEGRMGRMDLPPPVHILDVPVHPVSRQETLDYIRTVIETDRRAKVMSVNARAATLAGDDPAFREALLGADLSFCDGKAIQWVSRLHGSGRPLPERFTPPDWIDDVAADLAAMGGRLFLLGSREPVVREAGRTLGRRHPNLEIRTHHGYFDKQGPESARVIASINEFRPHILAVGFGMPLQEKWISENWEAIEANVVISVGALFEYVSGRTRRAPRWMRERGLEWLGRLLIEPRRLGARYMREVPLFLWRTAADLISARKGSGDGE